jgi:hypothetical protein
MGRPGDHNAIDGGEEDTELDDSGRDDAGRDDTGRDG